MIAYLINIIKISNHFFVKKYIRFIFGFLFVFLNYSSAFAKDGDRFLKEKEYLKTQNSCFEIVDQIKKDPNLINNKKSIWQDVCSLAVKQGEANFPESIYLPELYQALGMNTRLLNVNSLSEEKINIFKAENYYLNAEKKYQYFSDNNIYNNKIGWLIQIGKINRNLSALLKDVDINKSYFYIEKSLNALLDADSIKKNEIIQYNDLYGWGDDYKDIISKRYFNYSGYLAFLYKNNNERYKAKKIYDLILPNNNCKEYKGWDTCISQLGHKARLYGTLGFIKESKKIYQYIVRFIDDYGLNDKKSSNYNYTDYCSIMWSAANYSVDKAKEKYNSFCNEDITSELSWVDLQLLAKDYAKNYKYKQAYDFAYDASQKLLKIYPRENIEVIKSFLLMGEILLNDGKFSSARDLFETEFYYIYKNNYPITEDLTRYKMFYFASLLGSSETEENLINSLFVLKDIISDDKKSLIRYSSRLPIKERLTLLSSETYQHPDNLILSVGSNFVKWNLNQKIDENSLLTEKVVREINNVSLFSRLNRKGLLEQIERNQSLLKNSGEKVKSLNQKLNNLYAQLEKYNHSEESLKNIQVEKNNIENQLFKLLPDFKEDVIDTKLIFESLPSGAILIDVKKFKPYVYTPGGGYDYADNIYSALIVEKNADITEVELGESKVLDGEIKSLLKNIEEGNDTSLNLENINALFIKPLEKYLKNNDEVFLSLDSYLNYIPINLLKNQNNNRFWNDEIDIRLISSPRELIQLMSFNKATKSKDNLKKAVVFANPSFNSITKKINQSTKDDSYINSLLRSSDNCRSIWNPLPSTQSEGENIKRIINAKLFTREKASEEAIKSLVYSPSILHIATHGFYCSTDSEVTHPLLQSGIVLAGANNHKGESTQNGVLTALEFTQLDLSGTDLAVLSSCESAIGKDEIGEGIMGLRRALAVAGARSSILSLWKVDDNATSKFMQLLYEKLKMKVDLIDALKQTQNEFRNGIVKSNLPGINWSDPFYWAAFQLSGDWRSIEFN